jgi:hypothetical protein
MYTEEQEFWRDAPRTPAPAAVKDVPVPATEKQVSYLEGLRDGKLLDSLTPEQIAWLRDADFTKIPKSRASDVIAQLKELPWAPRDAAHDDSVPSGRYAIPKTAQQIAGDEAHSPGADSRLMFYSVKQGKSVTWVDVWASDARYPVKSSEERHRILEAIKADPDAGPRFGREIGRCYVCGRTLTDETSRALGIGPVCRGE